MLFFNVSPLILEATHAFHDLYTAFKHQLLEISLNFSKHEKLFQKILSYCHQSYPMFSRPLIHGVQEATPQQ